MFKANRSIFASLCALCGPRRGLMVQSFLAFSVFICVHLCSMNFVWASPVSAPAADSALDEAGQKLEKAKAEVQRLKEVWDKARLETTLYDQRSQRAYKRWVAAKKDWKKKMAEHKDQAQLELELSIEKRKLAYSCWQEALYRQMMEESQVKALDQQKDTKAIEENIRHLQAQLGPSTPSVKPIIVR